MPYTIVQLCNAALTQIGEKPINSLTDDTVPARTIANRYRQVIQKVLAENTFSVSINYKAVNPDAGYSTPIRGFTYQYTIPSDSLRLLGIYDSNSDKVLDYELFGDKILARVSTIVVAYVRDITDAGIMPPDLGEAIATLLAWDVSERLRPDPQLRARLEGKYDADIRRYRMRDAQTKPPKYYGTFDPYNKQEFPAPVTWSDIR